MNRIISSLRLLRVRRPCRSRSSRQHPCQSFPTPRSRRCATMRSQRRLCLGHRRRADDRSRPAPRRHRSRGARARLGGRQAEVAGLRQRPRRAVHDAGLDARGGKRGDRRALPAEAGRRRARQQRLDRPGRHHRRSRRLRLACPTLEAAPDCAVRGKIVFVDHAMPPDAGRLGLRLVRRAAAPGPDHRQPERRAGDRHPLDRHRPSPQPARRRPDISPTA